MKRMKGRGSDFHTTRWSVIQAAGGKDSEAARKALSELCENYWYPLYAFVRRSGNGVEDAEDLTQGFFARLLEKRDIGAAAPGRGKFRTYLLGSLKHFMANERDRGQALKRGGGATVLPIDFLEADRRYRLEADEASSPERVFERQWARALLAGTMVALRKDYVDQGKQQLFDKLQPALLGDEAGRSREEVAEALGMKPSAVSVALHRLRKRFAERLRAEAAYTVSDPTDIDEELRTLLEALKK